MTPKLFIPPPDASGSIDGSVTSMLLDHLPNRVPSLAQCDVVIVPIAYAPNFVFNDALLAITKRVVVLDFLEHGWDAGEKENRLGKSAVRQFGHLASDHWRALDAWISEVNPRLTFMRELHSKHRTDTLLPIEWPCTLPAPPLQSREEFNARPFDVFNCWGYSHQMRPRLHGDIFRAMGDRGIDVISDWSQLAGAPPAKGRWFSCYSPWWCRQPRSRIMEIQQQSKLSVSMPGAGIKSFRHSESPVGCVMAMQEDCLAWTYPWMHGENCIRLREGREVDDLLEALKREDLFEIYLRSQDTVDRYRPVRYVAEYILPAIERVL